MRRHWKLRLALLIILVFHLMRCHCEPRCKTGHVREYGCVLLMPMGKAIVYCCDQGRQMCELKLSKYCIDAQLHGRKVMEERGFKVKHETLYDILHIEWYL